MTRFSPSDVADELHTILASTQNGENPSRQLIAQRLNQLKDALESGTVTAGNEGEYEEVEDLLNKELEKLKKNGWWEPNRNYVINWAIMGLNTWRFSILPFRAKMTAYRPAREARWQGDEPRPAGIVLDLNWIPTGITDPTRGQTIPSSLKVAEALIKLAKTQPDVKDTVRAELDWIERQFGIQIPSQVGLKVISEAPKVAKRRWGTNRLRSKRTFFPFDGGKPIQLGSFD